MRQKFEDHEICRDSNSEYHGDNLNTVSVKPKMSIRQLTSLLPPTHGLRRYIKDVVKPLKTSHSIQFVLHFDPEWHIPKYTCAAHRRKELHAETVMVQGLGRIGSRSTTVSARGKGLINMYLFYYQWTSFKPFWEILTLNRILELVQMFWEFVETNWWQNPHS